MLKFLKVKNSCDGKYTDSLDIRFTKACDNNCSFCIEKSGLNGLGRTNVDELIKQTLSSGKQSILILGGEPFLYVDDLYKYVNAVRPHVKEIFITTSIPYTLTICNDKVSEILCQIDGLNVSLHHHDYKINNDVLKASNPFNRINRLDDILNILSIDKRFDSSKVRVSVNLCKGYIDSKEELDDFLRVLSEINCKHVKINELQEVTEDLYVSFEKIYDIKLKSPYAFGCQTDISHLFNNGMKITLKRSCFKVQHESIAKNNVSIYDIIKLVYRKFKPTKNDMKVLYENGYLTNTWEKNK